MEVFVFHSFDFLFAHELHLTVKLYLDGLVTCLLLLFYGQLNINLATVYGLVHYFKGTSENFVGIIFSSFIG